MKRVSLSTRRARQIACRNAACVLLAGFALRAAPARGLPTAPSGGDPWTAAVAARTAFEAQAPHSKAGYTRILQDFRSIYHADPNDPHAPAAIEQVAELLAEQGRELKDEKSLHDAAAQCDFLLKGYPKSSAAHGCGRRVAALGAAQSDAADAAVAASNASPAANDVTSPPAAVAPGEPASPPLALVSGIRHWSTPTYTRVAIDLGDEVEYEAARVPNPDRLFFDLHHARLAPELAGKTFLVNDDGFLTKIRAAQSSDDVTRVVLDVHQVGEYSAFLLPNPYRLIIDIHGKAGPKAASASAVEAAPSEPVPAKPSGAVRPRPADVDPAAPPVSRSPTTAGGSSLPPMPVTDGSASFGLPARTAPSAKGTSVAVAAPRVVIPTRPTAAKPVPNSTTSRIASAGSEVAAVSDQPGKVEGTRRPTSAPVAERAAPPAGRQKAARPTPAFADTDAAPADAAPPTAAGETSLMRALGLKIGRIVIDAGHGGHDSGTLGVGGIEEKDVVLDVALRLGKLLHQRLGAEIVYTRADDTFIPLETRTAIANKAQADLFISVHANSSADPSARGVEVYYLNFTSDPEATRVAGRENAVSNQSVHELSDLVKKIALKDKIDESRELAADVDESLYAGLTKGSDKGADSARNEGLKNRGVKKAPFVVLIGANMPSILAEISFVTNPTDAAELRTPDYRERVAESLYAGVARYAGAVNGRPAAKPATMKVAGKR